MRKLFLLAVGLVVCVANAWATPDRTGRWDVGIYGAGILPEDGDVETGAYGGGRLTYGFTPYFAVGAEAGYAQNGTDLAGFDAGDVTAIPILADFYVRGHNPSPAEPYFVFGVGGVLFDFDDSDAVEAAGIETTIDDAFALKVGGGVDVFVSDNVALTFEGSYYFADAEVEVEAAGTTLEGESDGDFWFLGGGIKILI